VRACGHQGRPSTSACAFSETCHLRDPSFFLLLKENAQFLQLIDLGGSDKIGQKSLIFTPEVSSPKVDMYSFCVISLFVLLKRHGDHPATEEE
jgi:hypothetical protein